MQGQWIGKIEGEFGGTLRVELEHRGRVLFGNAYLFYNAEHGIPGFKFPLRLPSEPPFVTEAQTIYCYIDGGEMTFEDRKNAEIRLTERFGNAPIPSKFKATFQVMVDGNLKIDWESEGAAGAEALGGSETLEASSIADKSDLKAKEGISTWDAFRQWAVNQKPRRFIFRGQEKPFKLATTFHRTWRNDLNAWIIGDVRTLYGAIIEQISYPLQLGNLEHNAVIWSILQHHGYPTPLLDWTFSPFVAAYFAFKEVETDDDRLPRIFMFDKTAWEEKHGRQAFIVDAAPPQLVTLENMSVGNPRHGPQQSLSTVSNVTDIETFIRNNEKMDECTYLEVFDLKPSEAPQIMRELELMGITYGALFPGLDGHRCAATAGHCP